MPDAPDYLMAEIRYAVTHEGALHLEDVLTRRTRISIEYPHRGVDCADVVAERDGATSSAGPPSSAPTEVATYVARVEAERESQAADRGRGRRRGAHRGAGDPHRAAQPARQEDL